MLDFGKRRAAKSHTPAGTLQYIGPERDFAPTVELISYNASEVRSTRIDLSDGKPELPGGFVHLVNVIGVHDKTVINTIGDWFEVHPLAREDVMNTEIRPKVEEIEGHLLLSCKAIRTEPGDGLADEQISVLWKDDTVIVFQEDPMDTISGVVTRIKAGRGRIRGLGPDYLVAVLLDLAVDSYFPSMADLGDLVERLEAEIIENPDRDAVRRIYQVKRYVMLLRNTLIPTGEILSRLIRREAGKFSEETEPFLRDVQDHLLQAQDTAHSLADLLSGLMDLHVSLSSMRMNEVMKVLTVIATIFIPLTFISGVYGMNFEHMPELGWRYGYFAILGVMAVAVIFMLRYFKKKHWL
jgi:magnesium transporter